MPALPRPSNCCEGVLGRGGGSTPGSTVYVQLYVLFPSLMRSPMWLRRDFTNVKTSRVQVGTGSAGCRWQSM